ncbi:MAG: T9SS type A sorting domain-containing protein [candidate division WOR-3 bacterium]
MTFSLGIHTQKYKNGSEKGALRLADVSGRIYRLWEISDEEIHWNVTDFQGKRLLPGIYFLTLDSKGRISKIKIVVLR